MAPPTRRIDGAVVERIAKEIAEVRAELGTEMAVVVGGGNIWRGATGSATGMDRASADYMGMLATVINALALQDALERQGQPTRVQTAIGMSQIAEPYIRLRAIRHLEKGRVVVFAGRHRQPVLHHRHRRRPAGGGDRGRRAAEGHPRRRRRRLRRRPPDQPRRPACSSEVSFDEVIARQLRAMDLTAITLCKENNLPIHVFSIMEPGNLRRALQGEQIGTLIR